MRPTVHIAVMVLMDEAHHPLQSTITKTVDGEVCSYLTFDATDCSDPAQAFAEAEAEVDMQTTLW